jgi:leader peptidase (prepilin peptidase)/N-methyltransferase
MNILTTTPFPLQITALLLLGLTLGSFINVCIHRLPKKESIIAPRSYCQSCKTRIPIWDNIPVLSYLLLKGKCRQCTASISLLYPVVEVSTALLLLTGFIQFGMSMKFAIFCAIGPTLLTVAIIDIKHKIIPDTITLPGIIFGIVAGSYLFGLKESLLGLISGGGIFLLSSEIYYQVRGRVGMGGGDIKFIAAVGALLGLKQVLLVIFLSAFIGSVVGLIGLIGKKLDAMSQIPFGPFLAVGTLIVYFSGENIINMYITTIMGGH